MEGFEARLLSRFKWGMQVELERPDISLRRDVLKLKAEQDGLALPSDVADYIASNVTQSVRELEGVVVSLMAHATVLNRDISLDLARRVMANAVKIKRRRQFRDDYRRPLRRTITYAPIFYLRKVVNARYLTHVRL